MGLCWNCWTFWTISGVLFLIELSFKLKGEILKSDVIFFTLLSIQYVSWTYLLSKYLDYPFSNFLWEALWTPLISWVYRRDFCVIFCSSNELRFFCFKVLKVGRANGFKIITFYIFAMRLKLHSCIPLPRAKHWINKNANGLRNRADTVERVNSSLHWNIFYDQIRKPS